MGGKSPPPRSVGKHTVPIMRMHMPLGKLRQKGAGAQWWGNHLQGPAVQPFVGWAIRSTK